MVSGFNTSPCERSKISSGEERLMVMDLKSLVVDELLFLLEAYLFEVYSFK